MSSRENHIFIVEFLLSGKTIGDLLKSGEIEKAKLILDYIRSGQPYHAMAMTDPVMFIRLRNAVTRLIVNGWY